MFEYGYYGDFEYKHVYVKSKCELLSFFEDLSLSLSHSSRIIITVSILSPHVTGKDVLV